MDVLSWPFTSRQDVVCAFRATSDPDQAGVARALRRRGVISSGVAVHPRTHGRLGGQLRLYSALNADSARLERHGRHDGALKLALLAAELESTSSFQWLCSYIANAPPEAASDLAGGSVGRERFTDVAWAALVSIASETERRRQEASADLDFVVFVKGRVSETNDHYVIVEAKNGLRTSVPTESASAVGRSELGQALVIASEKVDHHTTLFIVSPGIESDAAASEPSSPFGRPRGSVRITESDAAILRRTPGPLQILVPVHIG